MRNTQLTNNLFFGTGFRAIAATKTIANDQIGSGLNQTQYILRPNYRLIPGIAAFLEYEHVKYHGVLKNIRLNNGESKSEDSIFIGLSFII